MDQDEPDVFRQIEEEIRHIEDPEDQRREREALRRQEERLAFERAERDLVGWFNDEHAPANLDDDFMDVIRRQLEQGPAFQQMIAMNQWPNGLDDPFQMMFHGEDFRMFEREQQQPPPVVAAPVVPRRRYPVDSGFPIVAHGEFNKRHRKFSDREGVWQDLSWAVVFTTHNTKDGIMAGKATLSFDGLKDRAYKISATYTDSAKCVDSKRGSDDVVIIDKDRCQIVFPRTMHASRDSGPDNHIFVPNLTVTVTIHNIELIPGFHWTGHLWPMGTKYVTYCSPERNYLFNVRMNTSALVDYNPCIDKLFEDLKNGTLSENEVKAFFEFTSVFFHRWYKGTDKFHQILLNGYKLGFTQNWTAQDNGDTDLDFMARTMLPLYQYFLEEDPKEEVVIPNGVEMGSVQCFPLKLNPKKHHLKSQIEPMENIKGHKGQYTIWLEETNHGTLLMIGICLQVHSRQQARMKVDFVENGHVTTTYSTNRVIDNQQKTIKMVLAVLTEDQLNIMDTLSVIVRLHLQQAHSTFIENHLHEMDYSSPYAMPGVINGFLKCRDNRKIGICREHVGHYSDWLNQFFFNTVFADCGKKEVEIDEDVEVVLEIINIIYHRSHSVSIEYTDRILDLAAFMLIPVVTRYMDIAILNSKQHSNSEKLEIALQHHLYTCKYILRHQEYAAHDYIMPLTDTEMRDLQQSKTDNELDCGDNGRQPRVH